MIRIHRRAHPRQGALPVVIGALALAIAIAGCLPASVRPTTPPPPTPGPTPTAPPTPTPTPGPPTPTPGPTFRLYKVQRGDTLTRVARRFKTSTRSLSYWNREKYPTLDPESARYRPDRLELGWVLQVIPNKEYVAPEDDGETGIEVTPTPDDEEFDASPDPSGSPVPSASP
ncbi:MAG TPA: LysM domain-containing protein [Candidatus Limnocylindrales bacterium]